MTKIYEDYVEKYEEKEEKWEFVAQKEGFLCKRCGKPPCPEVSKCSGNLSSASWLIKNSFNFSAYSNTESLSAGSVFPKSFISRSSSTAPFPNYINPTKL